MVHAYLVGTALCSLLDVRMESQAGYLAGDAINGTNILPYLHLLNQ